MKMGGSSLNPYAASYVPISRRWNSDENKDKKGEVLVGNETVWYEPSQGNALTQGQHQSNVPQGHVQTAGALQTAEFSKWKDSHGGESYASSSQFPSPTEKHGKPSFYEEYDMDLDFLQMTFPGISEESLSDVYFANRCDLDAAIDMLNQLEVHPDDTLNKLPDTLDIGDVSEPGPSIELATQKLKAVTVEAGTSASDSANSLSIG